MVEVPPGILSRAPLFLLISLSRFRFPLLPLPFLPSFLPPPPPLSSSPSRSVLSALNLRDGAWGCNHHRLRLPGPLPTPPTRGEASLGPLSRRSNASAPRGTLQRHPLPPPHPTPPHPPLPSKHPSPNGAGGLPAAAQRGPRTRREGAGQPAGNLERPEQEPRAPPSAELQHHGQRPRGAAGGLRAPAGCARCRSTGRQSRRGRLD